MGLFPLKQTKMGVGGWGHHLPVTQRMWCLITWGDRWRKRTILNTVMAQGLALWTGLLGALSPVFQQCFSAGSFSESHLLLALLPHLSLSSLARTASFLLAASELSVLNPEMQSSCWLYWWCVKQAQYELFPAVLPVVTGLILVPAMPRCCCSFKVLPVSASSGTINTEIIFCIYLHYFPCCLVNKYSCWQSDGPFRSGFMEALEDKCSRC